MAAFDSNGNGAIDYSEFLFVFFNRRDVVRRWQTLGASGAVGGAAEVYDASSRDARLRVARLKASMLANSRLSGKGDGMVSRAAAETVLLAEGLFESKVCDSVCLCVCVSVCVSVCVCACDR